jgi:hypothetical protein
MKWHSINDSIALTGSVHVAKRRGGGVLAELKGGDLRLVAKTCQTRIQSVKKYPLDACEVSCRARAEEVALRHMAIRPRIDWVPRSKSRIRRFIADRNIIPL